MTIAAVEGWEEGDTERRYKCRWFNDKGQLTDAVFTEAELKRAPSIGNPFLLERG
jgi:uncharacterized protein YodC (DUF2158 family)